MYSQTHTPAIITTIILLCYALRGFAAAAAGGGCRVPEHLLPPCRVRRDPAEHMARPPVEKHNRLPLSAAARQSNVAVVADNNPTFRTFFLPVFFSFKFDFRARRVDGSRCPDTVRNNKTNFFFIFLKKRATRATPRFAVQSQKSRGTRNRSASEDRGFPHSGQYRCTREIFHQSPFAKLLVFAPKHCHCPPILFVFFFFFGQN